MIFDKSDPGKNKETDLVNQYENEKKEALEKLSYIPLTSKNIELLPPEEVAKLEIKIRDLFRKAGIIIKQFNYGLDEGIKHQVEEVLDNLGEVISHLLTYDDLGKEYLKRYIEDLLLECQANEKIQQLSDEQKKEFFIEEYSSQEGDKEKTYLTPSIARELSRRRLDEFEALDHQTIVDIDTLLCRLLDNLFITDPGYKEKVIDAKTILNFDKQQ
ncbi:MAG: hypothetical protein JWN37_697 [Candidatus Nomurabacteria bacterium]|nr:hypothetical protein [Candidatus Nomurabacteria bacterium]